MIKLYGAGPSRSLRVMWALRELGVDFEFVPVSLQKGEHHQPEFLRLNPAHKVPVLVDGEVVLTESAAIVLYLAEKYPERGLIPTDLKQRAEMYRWIMFVMTELEQPLWRMARHQFIYPEDKRLAADIELARNDFRDMAKVFEQHMAARQTVLGDAFSAADCVAAYLMDWASMAQMLDGFPHLHAYLERMYARPQAPQRMAAALAAAQADH